MRGTSYSTEPRRSEFRARRLAPDPNGTNRPLSEMNRSLLSFWLLIVSLSCAPGLGPSEPDLDATSIEFLPSERQVLVVGERRSLWISARSDELELSVASRGAIRELGRERPFGDGMIRLDVAGLEPGTATVRARLQDSEATSETTFEVTSSGAPRCEIEGPPPYCVTGPYRMKATELGDQCTGERDTFETTAQIARTTVSGDSATLTFVGYSAIRGRIGPDGAFFTELPQMIGSFRDGRQVVVEASAIRVAGFVVEGRLDVIGLFPSPDPIDEAPCERSWVLEGERL